MAKKKDPSQCDHFGAEELGQGWQEVFGHKVYIMHFHCHTCGLIFGKELRK